MGNAYPNRERSDRVCFAYIHGGVIEGLGIEHDEGILKDEQDGKSLSAWERSNWVTFANQKAL